MAGRVRNGILLTSAAMLAFAAAAHPRESLPEFVNEPASLEIAGEAGVGPLFTADSVFAPGAVLVRTVTVSRRGRITIFMSNFNARSADSAPTCTASDFADRISFSVSTPAGTAYEGTLAHFAGRYSSARDALLLDGPGSDTIFLRAGLDQGAGIAYMGCRSTADLVWSES